MIGFKSHIKMILCYPFKLKYLNKKIFYSILKKQNFFLGNIEYIHWWVLNSTFEREKKNTGSHSGLTLVTVDPPGRSGLAGSVHRLVFWQTRTSPTPGTTGSQVDPPAGLGLITIVKRIAKMKKLNFYLLF
jgi:hypothetical protein